MSSNDEPIKNVSWQDLCPWLLILRSIPISTGMGVIILATIGVILTPIGWRVSQWVFVSEAMVADDYHLNEAVEYNSSPYTSVFAKSESGEIDAGLISNRLTGPALVFRKIVEPFYHMFHDIRGISQFLYYLLGGIWTLLIWGFFGTAICRIAMMQLTRGERIGIDGAISYAYAKCGSALGSIVFPLTAVAVLCIPMAGLGLLLNLNVGVVIVGVIWFVVILLAVLMAILLIGLLFGWPLAIASVSAEGQDSFDAMTRSFAYTFQRPLHYIFYAFIALLVGGIIWTIAARFTEGVINLSYWGTSWGANVADANRIDQIRDPAILEDLVVDARTAPRESEFFGKPEDESQAEDRLSDDNPKKGDVNKKLEKDNQQIDRPISNSPDSPTKNAIAADEKATGDAQNKLEADEAQNKKLADANKKAKDATNSVLLTGNKIIGFWNSVIRTIGAGFLHGMFWCMFSAVYLLLRRDVDDTEVDEIFLDDERQTFSLPPLKNDENGMPELDQDPAKTETIDHSGEGAGDAASKDNDSSENDSDAKDNEAN